MDAVRTELANIRLEEMISKSGETFEGYMSKNNENLDMLPAITGTYTRKRPKPKPKKVRKKGYRA